MKNKIFCIGLNKTGTSSLHEAFKILGIKSVHYKDDQGNNIKHIIRDNYLNGDNILNRLEDYEAFSDWGTKRHLINIVKAFDRQYPNSKFILNTRPLNAWLDSREKHVKRAQKRKEKHPHEHIPWLKVDKKNWEILYKEYHKEVLNYFKDRNEELLIFDVSKGDSWEKLCPFLDLPIPHVAFPKVNVAPKQSKMEIFIQKFKNSI